MSHFSAEFEKAWLAQSDAAEGLREYFGLPTAMDYLLSEKLNNFI
jgi:hypothetical protein